MLSESSDVQSHIQYCNKHLNANITDAEVAEAAELHDQLIKEMKKNGVEKKSCDCIFIWLSKNIEANKAIKRMVFNLHFCHSASLHFMAKVQVKNHRLSRR